MKDYKRTLTEASVLIQSGNLKQARRKLAPIRNRSLVAKRWVAIIDRKLQRKSRQTLFVLLTVAIALIAIALIIGVVIQSQSPQELSGGDRAGLEILALKYCIDVRYTAGRDTSMCGDWSYALSLSVSPEDPPAICYRSIEKGVNFAACMRDANIIP